MKNRTVLTDYKKETHVVINIKPYGDKGDDNEVELTFWADNEAAGALIAETFRTSLAGVSVTGTFNTGRTFVEAKTWHMWSDTERTYVQRHFDNNLRYLDPDNSKRVAYTTFEKGE